MSTAIATLEARLPFLARARRARPGIRWRRGFVPGPLLLIGILWVVIAYFLFRSR